MNRPLLRRAADLLLLLLAAACLGSCEPPSLSGPGASASASSATAPASAPADGGPRLAEVRRVAHANGITEVKYENGLTLLAKPNHAAPVAAVRVYVGVGSLYEGDRLGSGVSHYFEHVISGGTTVHRTERESKAILERIGNNSNAYTTRDHTAYYITTESKHFRTAVDLLGDFMGGCLIKPEEFNRERGVIVQEIRMGYDNPQRTIHQLLDEAMFPGHPAGQPVIGHLELFREVTRNDVDALYRQYYVGNNMVVAAVGDFTVEEAADAVAKSFTMVSRGSLNRPVLPPAPRQVASRWAELRSPKVQRVYLLIGHHTVSLDHPDLFALDVTADILGRGRTSRLYRALRDTGLVDGVYAYSHTPAYNAGVFGIGATLEEKHLPAVLEAVLGEIQKLKTDPPGSDELARAKQERIASETYDRETMEAQAVDLGSNYLFTGDPNFTDRYLDGIRAVRAEEVQRAAVQYLGDANRTVAVLRPGEPAAAEQTAAESAAEPEQPRLEKIVLPNGLRVLYGYDPHIDSVLVQAAFLGGVLDETPEENGLCRLATTMLLQGTKERDKQTLHAEVERLGARLYSASGNNSWYVGLKLLKEDAARGMEILSEILLQPRFAEEDFARERELQRRAVRARDESWQAEIQALFRREFFQTHPYALDPLGTAESLARLTAADVAGYHARTLNTTNGVIAICGNIPRDEALAAAQKAFVALPLPSRPPASARPARPALRETVSLLPNEKTQVALLYGFDGVAYDSPDLPALTVLDTLLSGYGYPGGWLEEELRGTADLVYLVHAWAWPGLGTGAFQLLTQTSPENLPQVRTRIDAALARARAGRFTPQEIDAARETIVISEAIGNEQLESRAQQASFDELYGAGYDFHDRYAERIRAVTAEDLRRVAGAILAKRLLCATGPAAALATLGPLPEPEQPKAETPDAGEKPEPVETTPAPAPKEAERATPPAPKEETKKAAPPAPEPALPRAEINLSLPEPEPNPDH